jgi:methyltransferase-like protein
LSAGSSASVCNQWHEPVGLSALERCLLPLLDGVHSHGMLADHLAEEVDAGRLRFIQNDKPLAEASALKEFALQQVVLGLAALRRKALLVA